MVGLYIMTNHTARSALLSKQSLDIEIPKSKMEVNQTLSVQFEEP